MGPQRRQKIPDAEWEKHKSVIERLFLKDKKTLVGHDGVIEFMEQHHDFVASKSQYEGRLRKWNFRKKLEKEDWILVDRIISERDRRGLQSEVWAFGERIEPSKVRKETLRYRNQDLDNCTYDLKSGGLPTGIIVTRPADQRGDFAMSPTLMNDSPVQERLGTIQHDASASALSETLSTNDRLTLYPAPIISYNSIAASAPHYGYQSLPLIVLDSRSRATSAVTPYGSPALGSMSVVDSDNMFISSSWTEWDDRSNPLQRQEETSKRIRSRIPHNASQLLEPDSVVLTTFEGLQRRPGYVAILQTLRQYSHILNAPSLGLDAHLATHTQTVAILTTISKELVGYGRPRGGMQSFRSPLVGWILSYLQQMPFDAMDRFCRIMPAPFSDALTANLLDLAAEAHANRVVEGILTTSRNVGYLLRCLDLKSTLLQICICAGQTNLVKLIFKNTRRLIWQPLRCCSSFKLNLKILTILMQLGHPTHWSLTMAIQKEKYTLETIIENVSPTHSDQTLDNVISKTFFETLERSRMTESQAMRLFETLADYFRKRKTNWHSFMSNYSEEGSVSCPLSKPLCIAISYRLARVVIDLLDNGASATPESLLIAVQNTNMSLITCLTEAGARPHGVYHWPDRNYLRSFVDYDWNCRTPFPHTDRYTTPYAEAIRIGFTEAKQFFDNIMESMESSLTSDSRFAIVRAAAEIGDMTILEQYLPALERERSQNQSTGGIRVHTTDLSCVLFPAIHFGQRDVILRLLDAGCTPSGFLKEVLQLKDKDTVHLLLKACPTVCSPSDITTVIQSRDCALLSTILENGIEAMSYETWLETTISTGRVDVLQLLLQSVPRQDWSSRSINMPSPLTVAIKKENADMVRLLLEDGARPRPAVGSNDASDLTVAARTGRSDLVQELLLWGADPFDNQALMILSKAGNITMIKDIMLEVARRYAKRNGKYLTSSLIIAMWFHHTELIKLLLPYVDLDHICHFWETFEICIIPTIGQSWDMSGVSPIGATIFRGDLVGLEMLRTLLDAGADVNAVAVYKGNDALTPLLYAIDQSSISQIDMLISAGAKLDQPASRGIRRTPLQLAAEKGNIEIVSRLLNLGAEVNAEPATVRGATALQCAARSGSVRIAGILIDNGAIVNAPACSIEGRTAFEIATEWGHLDMMLLLMHHGADLVSPEGEKQYQRACSFAKKNKQFPARDLAMKLHATALAVAEEVEGTWSSMDFEL